MKAGGSTEDIQGSGLTKVQYEGALEEVIGDMSFEGLGFD